MNDEQMLDICACNDFVLTNTLFQTRTCHHMTAERATGHMTDYVLASRRFCSSILDTRVYRETYLHFDHMLVV